MRTHRSWWPVLLLSLACDRSPSQRAAPPGPTPPTATMKALRFGAYGPPGVLSYEDAPRPADPGHGELLVRVHAAGVNPLDHKIRAGHIPALVGGRFPFVPGWDLAGVVEAVGDGDSAFAPGDPIYAMLALDRGGACAEYALVRTDEAAPRPRTLDFEAAAAVPLAGLTAWQALVEHGALAPGMRVLVHGGSGGVGSFAVQIARAHGAHVAATASAANLELLRELGVEQAIDYRAGRFEDTVGEVDLVLDTVGGETLARSIAITKAGGVVVSIVATPDPEALAARGVRGVRMVVHPDATALAELGARIDAGQIRPVVSEVFEIADAARAHEAVATGHTRGKIVLRVAPR